jgi:hypothetical protein
MSLTIYVPRDSAALAVGAERVAERIAQEAAIRGVSFGMVRNGSRGLFWLEPRVEVSTPAGRVAYGPVTIDDVADLFDAGFAEGAQTQFPPRKNCRNQVPTEKSGNDNGKAKAGSGGRSAPSSSTIRGSLKTATAAGCDLR